MASSLTFSYSPLQDASKDIRLLRILPASNTDNHNDVYVTMEKISNYKSLVYDALSYAWGDASKTKTIFVNDCQFEVTENLYAGLLELRDFEPKQKYSRNEFIWIDALCINQTDDNEKSLQVQRMRDIFSEAAQVIVWLGTPKIDVQLGMDTIVLLVEAYSDYKALMESNPHQRPAHYDKLLVALKEFISMNQKPLDAVTDSTRHIFHMPWWDRLWILQEVAVAKEVWVLFGSNVLGFGYFGALYDTIRVLRNIPDSEVANGWSLHIDSIFSATISSQRVVRSRSWLDAEVTLLEALKELFVSSGSQATNPRDRFYALIGLGVKVEAMVGMADYSIPWKELYTKAAKALVKEYGLEVLSYCAPSRQQNGLPSWVPDWTQYVPYPLCFGFSSGIFNACGNTSRSVVIEAKAQEITLIGARVAKIRDLRDPWSLPTRTTNLNPYPWETVIAAMKLWSQNISTLASSFDLPDDIIMSTTSADLFRDNVTGIRRLRPEDQPAYEAFLKTINCPLPLEDNLAHEEVSVAIEEAEGYYAALNTVADTRRPFKSDKGFIGLAPESAEIGDIICIFHGGVVPFVLRPEADGRYRLLGEAYVHGIMDGEFMSTAHSTENFVLC
jgi:heterokaryon incompatibility protein (HET)